MFVFTIQMNGNSNLLLFSLSHVSYELLNRLHSYSVHRVISAKALLMLMLLLTLTFNKTLDNIVTYIWIRKFVYARHVAGDEPICFG